MVFPLFLEFLFPFSFLRAGVTGSIVGLDASEVEENQEENEEMQILGGTALLFNSLPTDCSPLGCPYQEENQEDQENQEEKDQENQENQEENQENQEENEEVQILGGTALVFNSLPTDCSPLGSPY